MLRHSGFLHRCRMLAWAPVLLVWVTAADGVLDELRLVTTPTPAAADTFSGELSDPVLPALADLERQADETIRERTHESPEATTPELRAPADQALETPHLEPLGRTGNQEAQRVFLQNLHTDLKLARQHRKERNFDLSRRLLMSLLEGAEVPEDLRRASLMELALLEQDAGSLAQAQRVLAHYRAIYPQHSSVPEVLLRQGLLYREMGAVGMAIAKFYEVMTSALNLNLEQLDHYERIVLQAQSEIGETYYSLHRYADAAECFRRLLKRSSPHLNKAHVHYKLVASVSRLGDSGDTIAQAESFLELFPEADQVPEVRFILAINYRQAGRGADAQRQILALLESKSTQARRDPQGWIYWQKRAGNEIANQLYQEGDFPATLTLYQHLAALDPSAGWQIPALYQIGLVFERLRQDQQAALVYTQIVDRQKELTGTNLTPSLASVIEMARWRRQTLGWLESAQSSILDLQQDVGSTSQ